MIDGLQAGVGKGLLGECTTEVATGESLEPLPYNQDDQEQRKVITSAFRSGSDRVDRSSFTAATVVEMFLEDIEAQTTGCER
jgi:hypothetical protein